MVPWEKFTVMIRNTWKFEPSRPIWIHTAWYSHLYRYLCTSRQHHKNETNITSFLCSLSFQHWGENHLGVLTAPFNPNPWDSQVFWAKFKIEDTRMNSAFSISRTIHRQIGRNPTSLNILEKRLKGDCKTFIWVQSSWRQFWEIELSC